jgi:hypothetical protein
MQLGQWELLLMPHAPAKVLDLRTVDAQRIFRVRCAGWGWKLRGRSVRALATVLPSQ